MDVRFGKGRQLGARIVVLAPRLHEEIARLNLDLDPQSGVSVARIVSQLVTTTPAIVAKVKAITDEGR